MFCIRASQVPPVPEQVLHDPITSRRQGGVILKVILGWLIVTCFSSVSQCPYRTLASSSTAITATMIAIHARVKVTLIKIPDVNGLARHVCRVPLFRRPSKTPIIPENSTQTSVQPQMVIRWEQQGNTYGPTLHYLHKYRMNATTGAAPNHICTHTYLISSGQLHTSPSLSLIHI